MRASLVASLLVGALSCKDAVVTPPGGDGNRGDNLSSGDSSAGDPMTGDPVAGDPPSGDPTGDPMAGDPAPELTACSETNDACENGETCLLPNYQDDGHCFPDCTIETGGCSPGATCIGELIVQGSQRVEVPATGTCDGPGVLDKELCNEDVDCSSGTCIAMEGLPGGSGFCAVYATGVTGGCTDATNCPANHACYEAPDGDTFCAVPHIPADTVECDPAVGGCDGTEVCLFTADGVSSLGGLCVQACDYSSAQFPRDGEDGCGVQDICYQAPPGSNGTKDGVCADKWTLIGAPVGHCDPDALLGNQPRRSQAACRGLLDAGGNFSTNHQASLVPRGQWVARCYVGAQAAFGTCGGDPSRCVPDNILGTPGACYAEQLVPCDPFHQTGCAPGQTCGLQLDGPPSYPPSGYISVCIDDGTGAHGDACGGGCGPGLACIPDSSLTATCKVFCEPGVDDCGADTCIDISRAFFADFGHIGVCMSDGGCDLLTQDCPTYQNCDLVTYDGNDRGGELATTGFVRRCVPQIFPGFGYPVGEQCWNGLPICDDHLMCGTRSSGTPLLDPASETPIDYCTRFCDPTTPSGNSLCPTSANGGGFDDEQTCTDVSSQYHRATGTIGVCTR